MASSTIPFEAGSRGGGEGGEEGEDGGRRGEKKGGGGGSSSGSRVVVSAPIGRGLGTLAGTLAISLPDCAQTSSIVACKSADFRRNSTDEGGGLKNRHRLLRESAIE